MDKALLEAVALSIEKARSSMLRGEGGPFGSAVIKDGKVISVASNSVLKDHDPSAHAEINAIRQACELLGTHDLSGCILYATGHPCPMCLSAIIWANIDRVYYGCEAHEAEEIGFRDDFIYRYLENKHQDNSVLSLFSFAHDECVALYEEYKNIEKEIY